MLGKSTIESILGLAIDLGGDFAEVFCEDSHYTNVLALQDGIETSSLGREAGVGIRIFNGLNSLYGYTTNTSSQEHLLDMVRAMTENGFVTAPSILIESLAVSGE